MILWIDDVRPAPKGEYIWAKSTNAAIDWLQRFSGMGLIESIDLDHDAGDYAGDGGDYIHILDWMEMNGINLPVHVHSMNPVGANNMYKICMKNGWRIY